jgi:hypothetical protein
MSAMMTPARGILIPTPKAILSDSDKPPVPVLVDGLGFCPVMIETEELVVVWEVSGGSTTFGVEELEIVFAPLVVLLVVGVVSGAVV